MTGAERRTGPAAQNIFVYTTTTYSIALYTEYDVTFPAKILSRFFLTVSDQGDEEADQKTDADLAPGVANQLL